MEVKKDNSNGYATASALHSSTLTPNYTPNLTPSYNSQEQTPDVTPSYNSNFNSQKQTPSYNSNFNSQKQTPSYNSPKDNSRSFKDLECWQKAHEFVKAVYAVTKQFPDDERYGLTSQFRRAAVSIAANICEGYKKLSRQDKLRFMNIAQGSLEECRYYIILSRDVDYIDQAAHDRLEYLINGASWKLNGYAEGISRNVAVKD